MMSYGGLEVGHFDVKFAAHLARLIVPLGMLSQKFLYSILPEVIWSEHWTVPAKICLSKYPQVPKLKCYYFVKAVAPLSLYM